MNKRKDCNELWLKFHEYVEFYTIKRAGSPDEHFIKGLTDDAPEEAKVAFAEWRRRKQECGFFDLRSIKH